ncbi:MAG TPA: cell division protein ZapA [Caulobacteraceae bacterium]|nr:cell division protein ZapA [Caulobacteraceae bacterium]
MAEVSVRVNGRIYPVGCEDGQEQHVRALAEVFDRHVAQVAQDVGQLGETRLFLMGALLMADELAETRGRLAAASADLAKAEADRTRGESRAVAALEQAARKVEALAAKAS